MRVLGISCYYHDAAAVLLEDGIIVAASEEERLSRKKHDSSFPTHAIDFCLKKGRLNASDLDYVVFYEKPFRKFHRILISSISTFPKSYSSFREAMRVWFTQKLWIKDEIANYLKINTNKIYFCEHHLSHAASCFYPSNFEKAAILTVDGVGEWTTTQWGIGDNNQIHIRQEIEYPHSLGLLYSAFTAFLGFEVNEGEWKVMGLAPYGKPIYTDKVWKTVKLLPDGGFILDLSYFSFHYSDRYSFSNKFVSIFGKPIPPEQSHLVSQKAADIASSIQQVTEEILLHITKKIRQKSEMENLCLAGGVALNSVANYRVLAQSGFKQIYIQPAAGDSGGALGAALYFYHLVSGKKIREPMKTVYYGQNFSNEEINQFLGKNVFLETNRLIERPNKSGKVGLTSPKGNFTYTRMSNEKLVDYITDKIIKGRVIGWMQGRFEWGPRALGDRSILADARNPKMKDIINSKVKFREAFRPFAPSVLAQHAHKVFDFSAFQLKSQHMFSHIPLRFMLYVVPVKNEWRLKVPAINHADNTARPQLVYKMENPFYYKLIEAFYKKTGVPLLLNTSFNLKGEPIVASPADAYSTFIRSGIDILVMENYILEKD